MKKSFLILLTIASVINALPQSSKPVKIASDIKTGVKEVWSSDTIYILKNVVFVESGATLTIEPGTIIKAEPDTITNSDATAALVVAANGILLAEGTAEKPIVFTVAADNPLIHNESFDSANISMKDIWSGLVILGNAPVGKGDEERVVPGTEHHNSRDPRYSFGGKGRVNPKDSSGVIRYVSIRFCGRPLGGGDREVNEIGGLTLCGVGSKTVIDHVEVFNSSSHAFCFIGGTARCRYLVAVSPERDAFKCSGGYRGRGQYLFGMELNERFGESWRRSGVSICDTLTFPVLANATLIGRKDAATRGIKIEKSGAGNFFGFIILNYSGGFSIVTYNSSSPELFNEGKIVFAHSLFMNMGTGERLDAWYVRGHTETVVQSEQMRDNFLAWEDTIVPGNIQLFTDWQYSRCCMVYWERAITDRIPFDVRPREDSKAVLQKRLSGAVYADGTGFIAAEPFIGAFDPWQPNWLLGWTALHHYKFTDTSSANVIIKREKPTELMPQRKYEVVKFFTPIEIQRAKEFPLALIAQTNNGRTIHIYDLRGRCLGSVQVRNTPQSSFKYANGRYITVAPRSSKPLTNLLIVR